MCKNKPITIIKKRDLRTEQVSIKKRKKNLMATKKFVGKRPWVWTYKWPCVPDDVICVY